MLKIEENKYIWVIGSPRSGTSFITDFIGKHTACCYNEPWRDFHPDRVRDWNFECKSLVLKYCRNWQNAQYLNNRFRKSYFVHMIRDPRQVLFSLVFPKRNSKPFRNLFDEKDLDTRFDKAVNLWYDFTSNSRLVCEQFNGVEIRYENVDLDKLSSFLNITFDEKLVFKSRNVEEEKLLSLERYWRNYKKFLDFRKIIES